MSSENYSMQLINILPQKFLFQLRFPQYLDNHQNVCTQTTIIHLNEKSRLFCFKKSMVILQ